MMPEEKKRKKKDVKEGETYINRGMEIAERERESEREREREIVCERV